MKLPEFEARIKQNIVQPLAKQGRQPGLGLVLGYDSLTNTATVVMSQGASNQIGETYRNVPCPIVMGQQSVAPPVGMQCWISFKDGTPSTPCISHFLNIPNYQGFNHTAHHQSVRSAPRFLTTM